MFNNYIKDKRNQSCLDLGFNRWTEQFYPRLKNHYKCSTNGCCQTNCNVTCPTCNNSFYCSEKCLLQDTTHVDVCAVTNTQEMIFIDSFLGWKLSPILSLIAMARNQPGVINIRSYDNIFDFKNIPNVEKLRKALKELSVYITYIPINEWKERYLQAGLAVPETVNNNQYKKKMIVNFQIEGMNKPQLHCLPLLDLEKSEPTGLKDFISDPISRLNTFQVTFDAL